MDQKSRPDLSEMIERLVKAKVINTDVTLRAIQEVVSAASSWDIDGGIEGWCGTIRRPWLVIRPTDYPPVVTEAAESSQG